MRTITALVAGLGERLLGRVLPGAEASANRYYCITEKTCYDGKWETSLTCCYDDYTGALAWCTSDARSGCS
jgi:hypothetical protein